MRKAEIPEDLRERYENACIGSLNYGESVAGAEYRLRMELIERIGKLTMERDGLREAPKLELQILLDHHDVLLLNDTTRAYLKKRIAELEVQHGG